MVAEGCHPNFPHILRTLITTPQSYKNAHSPLRLLKHDINDAYFVVNSKEFVARNQGKCFIMLTDEAANVHFSMTVVW